MLQRCYRSQSNEVRAFTVPLCRTPAALTTLLRSVPPHTFQIHPDDTEAHNRAQHTTEHSTAQHSTQQSTAQRSIARHNGEPDRYGSEMRCNATQRVREDKCSANTVFQVQCKYGVPFHLFLAGLGVDSDHEEDSLGLENTRNGVDAHVTSSENTYKQAGKQGREQRREQQRKQQRKKDPSIINKERKKETE